MQKVEQASKKSTGQSQDSFSNEKAFRECRTGSLPNRRYNKGEILAPLDVFKVGGAAAATGDDLEIGAGLRQDDGDVDDGTDAPLVYRSAREERIYLGRGYNRLGLGLIGRKPAAKRINHTCSTQQKHKGHESTKNGDSAMPSKPAVS